MPTRTVTRTAPLPPSWAETLAAAAYAQPDMPTDEGWQTAREIIRETGRSPAWVRCMLARGVDAGLIEVRRGTARTIAGCRIQFWYRRRDGAPVRRSEGAQ